MLQQAIRNRLESIGVAGDVATVLTEVHVDPNDIAFKRPTKPVGPFFTRYRADRSRLETQQCCGAQQRAAQQNFMICAARQRIYASEQPSYRNRTTGLTAA